MGADEGRSQPPGYAMAAWYTAFRILPTRSAPAFSVAVAPRHPASCRAMSDSGHQLELRVVGAESSGPAPPRCSLCVTFDLAAGGLQFEWRREGTDTVVTGGWLRPAAVTVLFRLRVLDWVRENATAPGRDGCGVHPTSVRALLNRIRKLRPLRDDALRLVLLPDTDLGPARAGQPFPLVVPPGEEPWKWLGGQVLQFIRLLESSLAAIRWRAAASRCGFWRVDCWAWRRTSGIWSEKAPAWRRRRRCSILASLSIRSRVSPNWRGAIRGTTASWPGAACGSRVAIA